MCDKKQKAGSNLFPVAPGEGCRPAGGPFVHLRSQHSAFLLPLFTFTFFLFFPHRERETQEMSLAQGKRILETQKAAATTCSKSISIPRRNEKISSCIMQTYDKPLKNHLRAA
jgi:hypothetical protein